MAPTRPRRLRTYSLQRLTPINTCFFILSLLLWGRAPSGLAEMGGGARLRPVPLPLVLLSGVLVLGLSRSGFAFSRPLPPRRAPLVYQRLLNVHRLAYGLQASPLPVPSLLWCRLGCVSVVDVPSLWLRHVHDAYALTRSNKLLKMQRVNPSA